MLMQFSICKCANIKCDEDLEQAKCDVKYKNKTEIFSEIEKRQYESIE